MSQQLSNSSTASTDAARCGIEPPHAPLSPQNNAAVLLRCGLKRASVWGGDKKRGKRSFPSQRRETGLGNGFHVQHFQPAFRFDAGGWGRKILSTQRKRVRGRQRRREAELFSKNLGNYPAWCGYRSALRVHSAENQGRVSAVRDGRRPQPPWTVVLATAHIHGNEASLLQL